MHDPPFLTRSRMRTRTSRTGALAGTGEVERERRLIRKRRNTTKSPTESLALRPTDSLFVLWASCAITPFPHHGKTSMFRSSYQSSLLSYRGHSGQNT